MYLVLYQVDQKLRRSIIRRRHTANYTSPTWCGDTLIAARTGWLYSRISFWFAIARTSAFLRVVGRCSGSFKASKDILDATEDCFSGGNDMRKVKVVQGFFDLNHVMGEVVYEASFRR